MKSNLVVSGLLQTVTSDEAGSGKRRSALWALGQIGSTDYGFAVIVSHMQPFVRYIVDLALHCDNYSLRGTAFMVLGLIGRSRGGAHYLAMEQWDVSPELAVAIAIPRDMSVLFTVNQSLNPGEYSPDTLAHRTPDCVSHLRPYMRSLTHTSSGISAAAAASAAGGNAGMSKLRSDTGISVEEAEQLFLNYVAKVPPLLSLTVSIICAYVSVLP